MDMDTHIFGIPLFVQKRLTTHWIFEMSSYEKKWSAVSTVIHLSFSAGVKKKKY